MNTPVRKAVLTGHSRGLGAAILRELLAQDVQVLAISRSSQSSVDPRLQSVALDLGDTDAVGAWLASDALEAFLAQGSQVMLINNAGLVEPIGALSAQAAADVMHAITVNVAAPLALSAAFVRAAPAAADKRVLHVSSGAGRNAIAGWSVYGATKAALDHHARGVLADGIERLRVCSLAPGVIDTDMQAQIRATAIENFPQRARFEALKADGNLMSPEDCARKLVALLLSADFGNTAVADLRELSAA